MTELVQPTGNGGSGSITVTDGSTTVNNVTTIDFTGATVSNGGGGTADVVISGNGFQQPISGNLNQAVFVWATAPNSITIDGVTYQKTQKDGTVMWTGTTTTTLTNAPKPNFDIFSLV